MKILLAADGSEYTKRAAVHLVKHIGWFARRPEIHLLHVRPKLPFPGAAAFAGRKAIDKYEREEAEAALKVATRILDKASIAHEAAWKVGDVAPEIAAYCRKNGIDLVVMGSHGHGALSNLALGSVATKILATVKVPVLVVR